MIDGTWHWYFTVCYFFSSDFPKETQNKEIWGFFLSVQWRMTYWCSQSQGGRCQRGRNRSGRDKYWLLDHWCDCWTGRRRRIPPRIWIWRSQGCKLDERERKQKGQWEQKKTKNRLCCHLSKRQAAVASVMEQKLYLWSARQAQYLWRECGCVRAKWWTLKQTVLSIYLHLRFHFHSLYQVTLISPKRESGWQLTFMLKRRKRRIKMKIDCWQEIAVVRQTGMENASEKRDTP